MSLVGVLLVLVALGVMAALSLSALSSSTRTPSVAGTGSRSPLPSSLVGVPSAALVASCEADAEALSAAVSTYRALNGIPPSPGLAGEEQLVGHGLATWPGDAPHFAFGLGPDGAVLITIGNARSGADFEQPFETHDLCPQVRS